MARKSRKQAVVSMPAPSLYVHVALYIRLSVEDNKKKSWKMVASLCAWRQCRFMENI